MAVVICLWVAAVALTAWGAYEHGFCQGLSYASDEATTKHPSVRWQKALIDAHARKQKEVLDYLVEEE